MRQIQAFCLHELRTPHTESVEDLNRQHDSRVRRAANGSCLGTPAAAYCEEPMDGAEAFDAVPGPVLISRATGPQREAARWEIRRPSGKGTLPLSFLPR